MRKLIALCVFVLVSGCFRLDGNLYNPRLTEEYQFDDFEGDQEIDLPEEYNIADSLIYLSSLSSVSEGEEAEIFFVYLGELSRIASDTVIVYCHGNFGNMDFYWNRAKLLANVGGKSRYGVLMMDYRGFGKSTGSITEQSLYDDVNSCLLWLSERGLSGDRAILYGFSLGGAPASYVTANPDALEPAQLILENPFASAQAMVSDASRLNLPASYFVNLEIDVSENVSSIDQPFLWMHGESDSFLRIDAHGEVIYDRYQGSRGEAVRVPNAEHGDLPKVLGLENYLEVLGDFIRNRNGR